MMIFSESDKRKVDALKNRTVHNGNTLEEEIAAQSKIKNIMSKYEGQSNPNNITYSNLKDYPNFNPQQQSPYTDNPFNPQQTPPPDNSFNPVNSDIVDEFMKYRANNGYFMDFMNARFNNKKEKESKKSYISCPNCGGTKFYTNKYTTKINETPLCAGCLKVITHDYSTKILNNNGEYEYLYFARDTTVKEIMDDYVVNFWRLYIVKKDLIKSVLKNEPIRSRIKFYIKLTLHRLNGILLALGI